MAKFYRKSLLSQIFPLFKVLFLIEYEMQESGDTPPDLDSSGFLPEISWSCMGYEIKKLEKRILLYSASLLTQSRFKKHFYAIDDRCAKMIDELKNEQYRIFSHKHFFI